MIFACISTAWVWNQKNNFPLCGCSSNRPCSAIRSLTCCYQHHVPKPVVCLGGHFRTQPKEIYVWVRPRAYFLVLVKRIFWQWVAPLWYCASASVCLIFCYFFRKWICASASEFQMNLRVCQWISRTSKLGGGWCTAKASTPQISKMLNSIG